MDVLYLLGTLGGILLISVCTLVLIWTLLHYTIEERNIYCFLVLLFILIVAVLMTTSDIRLLFLTGACILAITILLLLLCLVCHYYYYLVGNGKFAIMSFLLWVYIIVMCILEVFYLNDTKANDINPIYITDSSMSPTYNKGDRLTCIVNVSDESLTRGSIIRFKMPIGDGVAFDVKRIVAIECDTVEIINNKVYVNNSTIETWDSDNYVFSEKTVELSIKVGKDELFVLGDNQTESLDSRDYGCIKTSSFHNVSAIWYNNVLSEEIGE